MNRPAGPVVAARQVITEKDETEVIPKILAVITNDDRFVSFQEYWLPSELLIANIKDKFDEVRRIISKRKYALSSNEILENISTFCKDALRDRLKFSLEYFLDKDKRFVPGFGSVTKWDLRKPSDVIRLDTNKYLSYDNLLVSSDLEQLLFYHGFFNQCDFSFPNEQKVLAYYDSSKKTLSGNDFIKELVKISENKKQKVKFRHPQERGDPIIVYASTSSISEKKQWTVTIKAEWLEKGVLVVPRNLSNYIEGTNNIHILFDQVEEILPYQENDRLIERFDKFYSAKAIAEGDIVILQLQSQKPVTLFVSSRWKKRLDRLLQVQTEDWHWEKNSLRDCIIVVLANHKQSIHYRSIYAEIARHKHTTLGAIIGTLSRYCPSVFVHTGQGEWQICGLVENISRNKKYQPAAETNVVPIPKEIWDAVRTIEENDLVYKLLEKAKRPLSFDDICDKLAEYLRIDNNTLRATGFLRANDERLRRLDDGTWALEEWFSSTLELPEKPAENEPIENQEEQQNIKKWIDFYWQILLILFLLVVLLVIYFAWKY